MDYETTDDSQQQPFSTIARKVFVAWERLRLVYILILVLVTIAATGLRLFEPRVAIVVAVGAVYTNLCYFAGPIVETYVRWLGYHQLWVRWTLFVCGTIFAVLLAFATLASLLSSF